jgi:hypothetical protein
LSDGKRHVLLATNFKEYHLGWFAYRALKSLGVRVTVVSPVDRGGADDLIVAPPDAPMPDLLRGMADKPDLFLYVESSVGSNFFPAGVLDLDVPTAVWLGDNYLNFRWHKEYCAMYDHAFFCQYGRMRLAKKIWGCGNLHWLPFAADEKLNREFPAERDINVGYVGTVIPEKRKFFEKMEKAGVPVEFNKTFLKYDEIGRYYSRCKTVYNISARFDLNPRAFEACYAGAVMIGQRVIDEGFYLIFTPGVNADVHDFDDAPGIIKGYLADGERLRRVAKEGQKLVGEGHTYRHRIEELLRVCAEGVTKRRTEFAKSYQANMKMALVYQHPQFRMRKEAREEFRRAFKKSFFGSLLYLVKYGYWRVREKVEKTIWELGKRPV